MRTRTVFAFAAALLVLTVCASCGGSGGGGGSAGGDTPTSDRPANVAITWRGSVDAAGYVVHWGTTSREYSHEIDVSRPLADGDGNVTVIVALDAADPSPMYYFAITSYDVARTTSDFSNELSIDGSRFQ